MTKSKDAADPAPQDIALPAVAKPAKGKAGEDDVKAPRKKSALARMGLVQDSHDPELEGLMTEIEADLRADELKKIWERHGKLIIACVVLILVGVVGGQYWRVHQTQQRAALATRYDTAVQDLQSGKLDDAAAAFAGVAATSGEGYAALAQLQRASILLEKKDEDGALAIYQSLAADRNVDPLFRDLATLLRVLHSMDKDDPNTLSATLAPLTSPNNPFSASALELSAVLAAKQGNTARAETLLTQLLADPTVPQNMRTRDVDLLAYYKAKQPIPAPTAAAPAAAPPAASAPAAPSAAKPAAPPAAKP